MGDAYRTSARACPSCGNTALREFHDRLVCDECDGMLLTTDDLARSIHEIDGSSGSVAFDDESPSKKSCPRCQGAMTSAEVLVGHLKMGERSLHCARDGVWVSQGALAGLFAVASRLSHAHVSGRMYGGAGKSSSAPGLAISHWGESRPRAHTLFVSAYKDRTLGCPSCKETKLSFEGDLWSCGTCNGCFVEDAALTAMVSEMSGQPWQPHSAKGGVGERVCPVCDKPMIVEVLEAVTIDRCEGHASISIPTSYRPHSRTRPNLSTSRAGSSACSIATASRPDYVVTNGLRNAVSAVQYASWSGCVGHSVLEP